MTVILAMTPPPPEAAPLYLQHWDDIVFTDISSPYGRLRAAPSARVLSESGAASMKRPEREEDVRLEDRSSRVLQDFS